MKAIAATKIWDDMPAMDDVLKRSVTVLGSTDSIGVNTLDVIAHVRKVHGQDALPIAALTAGGNVKVLIGQARERDLPGLDAVLDDIELRARVELAKFGRYPA